LQAQVKVSKEEWRSLFN